MAKLRKKVFISGITSDIGKSIALRFAKEGWDIVGHYCSSTSKAEQIKKLIKKLNVNCYLVKADLSSKKDLKSLVSEIRKYNISTLINNAGTYIVSKHFSSLSIEEITDVFMVNAFSPMILSSMAFGQMKKQKFGRIVNISSIAAKYGGSSFSMHYGSSKLALEGLTKTLAREGAKDNILVNTLRPGVIDTQFHKKFPKDMKKRVAMIPVKRMGKPIEIADMAFYLGSENNSFITNEVITIAGGE